MCGFTGFYSTSPDLNEIYVVEILKKMSTAIAHRGPDSDGYWVDVNSGIGLGHRRLSIVDLSPNGAQPMTSRSGRYVIAFNGEIYNHKKLRNELKYDPSNNFSWVGDSDTETLLNCIECWGIDGTIDKLIGMFAFALWDSNTKKIILARDRIGEKPLYYGWLGYGVDATFLFGSDLSSFKQYPTFVGEVDRESLKLFMRYGYVGGDKSIYKGIHKLLPGYLLILDTQTKDLTLKQYWSILDVAVSGTNNPFNGTKDEAVLELEQLLLDAVGQQMIADVPLGAFLSGGIDSSTIVALMQANSTKPVRTFSIGFDESKYNEADYAKKVALELNTDHTEFYVTSSDALDVIPNLTSIYSEPFADSSQIPTFLVSKLAKQYVTVSLSGDAGDELFCGYERYRFTHKLWDRISKAPMSSRKLVKHFLTSIPTSVLDKFGGLLNLSHVGDKVYKGAALLDSTSLPNLYLRMVSFWTDPSKVVLGPSKSKLFQEDYSLSIARLTDVEYMMLEDAQNYLPDDILVKVDRAAMANSLETRVPFLDHRVVEFAWSLPLSIKLNNGVTKWPIRQILYKHVPKELIDRPKMGFGVPIADWLRGPLRDWAESQLSEDRLTSEGFFDVKLVRLVWHEHLTGKRNWQYRLWNVLMFQSWLESSKNLINSTEL